MKALRTYFHKSQSARSHSSWKIDRPYKVVILIPLTWGFKRRRLRISRIDGQTRKIENPDNLPEEHLWGSIFENVIVIF